MQWARRLLDRGGGRVYPPGRMARTSAASRGKPPARRSLWSVLLVAASLGCGAREDEPFIGHVHRSKFFEYHVRDPEPLCPTLLDRVDEHARTIGDKIGFSLNEDQPLRYYKFRDEADYDANAGRCSPGLAACAVGDAVYSSKSFHAHELVHAYLFRAWGGGSTGLLNEGEAVALSCDPFVELLPGQRPRDALQPLLTSLDWRALLYLEGKSFRGYSAAGFFVTHLAERYGWAKVAELHRRVPPGISVPDFERQFARVFPQSLDEAWAEALDTPDAPLCQMDWTCTATALTEGEPATPDCDGEMHRCINLAERAAVALAFEGDGSFKLADCSASASIAYSANSFRGGIRVTRWMTLPAGRYAVFRGDSDLPSHIEWRRSSLPESLVADTCEANNVIELDPEGDTVIELCTDSALGSGGTGWIRVAGGGRTFEAIPLRLSGDDPLDEGAVTLCDDCSRTASSVPLAVGRVTKVAIGDEAVVRLRGVRAPLQPECAQLVFAVRAGGLSP